MPSPRLALVLAAAFALAGAQGCNGSSTHGPSPAASVPRAMPAPAGADITALLDGLAVGDRLGGVPVAAIGAIDARGTIPIVLQQGDLCSVIVIAARTETPPPPVSTQRYSVFFERYDFRPQLPSQQMMDAVQQVGARLRKTEQNLPIPASLKPLGPLGSPA